MGVFGDICVCVLAAGESKRMNACKLLLPFAGTTLLDRALGAAGGCEAQEVIVITGAYRREVATVLQGCGAREVHNPLWKSGQASSVCAGVHYAIAQDFKAILFMVADQPFVTSYHLNTLMAAYRKQNAVAYVSVTQDSCGNPCLFDRTCFDALKKIEGDEGARSILRTFNQVAVRYISFDQTHLLHDIDTPSDLAYMEKVFSYAR